MRWARRVTSLPPRPCHLIGALAGFRIGWSRRPGQGGFPPVPVSRIGRRAGAGAHGFLDEAGIDAGEPELAAAEQPQRAVAGNVTPGEKRWASRAPAPGAGRDAVPGAAPRSRRRRAPQPPRTSAPTSPGRVSGIRTVAAPRSLAQQAAAGGLVLQPQAEAHPALGRRLDHGEDTAGRGQADTSSCGPAACARAHG
jgi:hypothetical protein